MIPEFQQLKSQIDARAFRIGRIIQSCHYIMGQTPYPAAHPSWTGVQGDYAIICIGKDDGGSMNVMVPVGLFETAGDVDIRVWANSENEQYERSQNADSIEAASVKREQEIVLMQDLMRKYPEVVNPGEQSAAQ